MNLHICIENVRLMHYIVKEYGEIYFSKLLDMESTRVSTRRFFVASLIVLCL